MKKTRILAIVTLALCALGIVGLVACSGGSGSSSASASSAAASSASASSAAAQQSDEELIKADIESIIGTAVSKEALAAAMRADDEMAALEAQGLDLDAYAENMANVFKFEVREVKVNGDTAVATTALTTPNFGEEMDALFDEALEAESANVDVANMSEEEQVSFLMSIVSKVLSDPNLPTATETFDIDYVKTNGTWAMADESKVESELGTLASSIAGI